MSVDIDWSLLSEPTSSSLSETLIAALNTQLNRASRPSFLGPVTVTSFDFGNIGPDVELKDIRDVWRAFDEGDDEGDAYLEAQASERAAEEAHSHSPPPPPPPPAPAFRRGPQRSRHSSAPLPGRNLHPSASQLNLIDDDHFDFGERDDANDSVYSGFHSGRNSVASVGLGVGGLRRGPPRYPIVPSTPPRMASTGPAIAVPIAHTHGSNPTRPGAPLHDSAAPLSPPPSPPAHPVGLPETRPNPLPSVQIHMRLDHASNMSLTLTTSLQVNYPSPLFMSLPLKLVITGLTLAADLVFAYSGTKHRVHVTIVDTGEDQPPTPGHGGHGLHGMPTGHYAIGQRVLPNLHIESDIGSADAHVLRNVGKVERFIVDVVRKTLVEELVFPNFQTIALA
ncbi:Mitochondrial distribution and morphology protein 12 [Apiotrichum porosum]|uniref:Mitochondrial distribution and morphology protein 12 n=1 Tax=Apiotrichum porosum TaxID=105984 RepID=A0A427YAJ9_9TREE|nr:Mitochondrial distribution and morphology protein 12 [Apiotrichum porosum]RSH88179.1 Mitochondrial distribution and morphology protein 12 [Apiotrichum porosum]